jgi:hypothetical protein
VGSNKKVAPDLALGQFFQIPGPIGNRIGVRYGRAGTREPGDRDVPNLESVSQSMDDLRQTDLQRRYSIEDSCESSREHYPDGWYNIIHVSQTTRRICASCEVNELPRHCEH